MVKNNKRGRALQMWCCNRPRQGLGLTAARAFYQICGQLILHAVQNNNLNTANFVNVHGNSRGQKLPWVCSHRWGCKFMELFSRLLCWELLIAAEERLSTLCNTLMLLYVHIKLDRTLSIHTFTGVTEQNNYFSPVDPCRDYNEF